MGSVSSANSGWILLKPSDAFNVDELLSLIAFEPLLRPLLNGALQVSQSPDLLFCQSSDLV